MSSALRTTRLAGRAAAHAARPAGTASSRAMHQDGRSIPHDATPSYTTSPPPPSVGSGSSNGVVPPYEALDAAGQVPYAAAPSSSTSALPAYPQSTTARSPTGRPLLVQSFTPKGRPVFTRPPVAPAVRAQIAATAPAADGSPFVPAGVSAEGAVGELAQRRRTHPLWRFFHVPVDARPLVEIDGDGRVVGELGDGAGMGSLDTLDSSDGQSEVMTSGRSWTAAELRQKSFADLHTLWYLVLRERNVLATQREERRRLGIVAESELITKRAFRCRKTLARIKYVLNERRLGLIAAVEGAKADSGAATSASAPIVGRSPLGAADPLSLTGFERGVRDVLARPDTLAPPRPRTRRRASSLDSEVAAAAPDAAPERPLVPSSDPAVTGDGERQKSLPTTPAASAPLPAVDDAPTVVPDEQVAREEVESRDEGFGGGREGEAVVKDLERRGL